MCWAEQYQVFIRIVSTHSATARTSWTLCDYVGHFADDGWISFVEKRQAIAVTAGEGTPTARQTPELLQVSFRDRHVGPNSKAQRTGPPSIRIDSTGNRLGGPGPLQCEVRARNRPNCLSTARFRSVPFPPSCIHESHNLRKERVEKIGMAGKCREHGPVGPCANWRLRTSVSVHFPLPRMSG